MDDTAFHDDFGNFAEAFNIPPGIGFDFLCGMAYDGRRSIDDDGLVFPVGETQIQQRTLSSFE